MNDFNRISPIYDGLKKLFFGQSLDKMTATHLAGIPASSEILIIGGGTGELLEHLHEKGTVTYVEQSSRMINRAGKRKSEDIIFVEADILTWDSDKTFDCIICPFVLDCFNRESLHHLLNEVNRLLKDNGQLIVVDFEAQSWYQRILIKAMYLFFWLFTHIEAQKLHSIHQILIKENFKLVKEFTSHSGFLYSRCYTK